MAVQWKAGVLCRAVFPGSIKLWLADLFDIRTSSPEVGNGLLTSTLTNLQYIVLALECIHKCTHTNIESIHKCTHTNIESIHKCGYTNTLVHS